MNSKSLSKLLLCIYMLLGATVATASQLNKTPRHEIYASWLIAYIAGEYRFLLPHSEKIDWYGALGFDGSIVYGSAHISAGARYAATEKLSLYGGFGVSAWGNKKTKVGPTVEFKIATKIDDSLNIQWFGFGIGDRVGYLQLPGLIFSF